MTNNTMNTNAIEIINAIVEDIVNPSAAAEDSVEEFANDVISGKEEEIDVGLQTDGVENPLEDALEKPEEIKEFKYSCQKLSVKTYLERFKAGKIAVPSCQRSAGVWKKDQEDRLVDTILSKLPIPAVTLGEVDEQAYVVDGLQRTTTLEHLMTRKDIDDETKKKIQSYQLNIVTVHDMDWESFEKYFYNCNNGTPLATAVKECASLPTELSSAINKVSDNSFFYEGEFGRTVLTNEQKRIMAMSMLLAATGLNSAIKAKDLAKAMLNAENLIGDNVDKAKANMDKVIEAFKALKAEHVKRGFNSNYVCAWGYLLVQYPEITSDEIAEVTMHIFEKTKAITPYSSTTGSGSAGWKTLQKRINVIADVLDEIRHPEEIMEANVA